MSTWKSNRADRIRVAAVAASIVLLAASDRLAAHAFAERYDLPLPLWHYLLGAALAVIASFVVAAAMLRSPGRPAEAGHDVEETRPAEVGRHRRWRAVVRGAAVCLFAVALTAGVVGVQGEPIDNLLPVMVWIIWWVGLTYVCALAGDVWSLIDPVATIARFTSRVVARLPIRLRRRQLPDALGIWPAVALFSVFAWAEMVWPENAVPRKLAWAIGIYCVTTWTAMAIYGVDVWLRRGDPFARFFGLVARVAPIDWNGAVLRPFGAGLMERGSATSSEMAFVLLALSTVSFDGVRETPFWNVVSSAASGWMYRAGLLSVLGNVWGAALVKTAGLLTMPLIFAALFLAACRWSAAAAFRRNPQVPRRSAADIARLFVISLVPIAVAYHVAHYLSYLLVQGQAIVPLISDPFGLGWDLFGTASYQPDLTIVSMRFIWLTVVVAIVAGHVASVVIAHMIAVRTFGGVRTAIASQQPMLVLMVGYTMFSLWLLSQPIVEGS